MSACRSRSKEEGFETGLLIRTLDERPADFSSTIGPRRTGHGPLPTSGGTLASLRRRLFSRRCGMMQAFSSDARRNALFARTCWTA